MTGFGDWVGKEGKCPCIYDAYSSLIGNHTSHRALYITCMNNYEKQLSVA